MVLLVFLFGVVWGLMFIFRLIAFTGGDGTSPSTAAYTPTPESVSAYTLTPGGICTPGIGADPVWRMPFWDPYESLIEPGIADLDNAPAGGFAGSITAALFLRRFVEQAKDYVHFDIYSWQRTAAPGRSKGGLGQGPRALLEALPHLLAL